MPIFLDFVLCGPDEFLPLSLSVEAVGLSMRVKSSSIAGTLRISR